MFKNMRGKSISFLDKLYNKETNGRLIYEQINDRIISDKILAILNEIVLFWIKYYP